jgi:alanyl-tRNA synthetase
LITGIERAKKQSRVHFLCGSRVLEYARRANRTLEAISQTISASPLDSAVSVQHLWDELQRTRRRVEDMESELLDHEAARFPVEGGLAKAILRDRGIDGIKLLAAKICSRPGVAAILAGVNAGDGQIRLVLARSADRSVDVSAVLKKVLEQFGGRGGGRPTLAQGGVTEGDPQEILDFAASLIR